MTQVCIKVYTRYMLNVIPITKARSSLLDLVDRVYEDYSRIDLTKKGVVKASLISTEYLYLLEETVFTLENSLDDIKLAEKELEQGKYLTLSGFNKSGVNAGKRSKNSK